MADSRDDLDRCQDEAYFDGPGGRRPGGFDVSLLRLRASVLPERKLIVMGTDHSVTEAIRAMQAEHRGCVLVTGDGSNRSPVEGIFTERDVLFRIVDRGRNPVTLPLGEVMTPDPECLGEEQSLAHLLNKMSVGGFRHVPIVDEQRRPVTLVSVRDVVEFLVAAFPREVMNLPSEFGPDKGKEREGA